MLLNLSECDLNNQSLFNSHPITGQQAFVPNVTTIPSNETTEACFIPPPADVGNSSQLGVISAQTSQVLDTCYMAAAQVGGACRAMLTLYSLLIGRGTGKKGFPVTRGVAEPYKWQISLGEMSSQDGFDGLPASK